MKIIMMLIVYLLVKKLTKQKKYAYVSDYARLKILYENGGIYFDTDVEVIRNMDNLVQKGAWMAIEKHKKYS